MHIKFAMHSRRESMEFRSFYQVRVVRDRLLGGRTG
jgi:hypothetical protein